ncbi:hypothetical protein [Persicobacter psychrovividus]|uniref:Haloacid dehalogenase-like hydrolase n=1 Tax=Persicobacter psychrovividus TaxID=387638 RepID=A0ABM7VEN0_9BACT|nr:hypothetical protein PEPS_16400 [Persicobacter psychrovividus]
MRVDIQNSVNKIRMEPTLVIFDLDNVIPPSKFLSSFIPFLKGRKHGFIDRTTLYFYKKLIQANLISEKQMLTELAAKYFKGVNQYILEEQSKRFFDAHESLLLPDTTVNKIRFHQLLEHQIVFMTSLPKNLLFSWCREKLGLLLGNELEQKNDLLTGTLRYSSINDTLQMNWIKQKITPEYYSEVIIYSNNQQTSQQWVTYRRP